MKSIILQYSDLATGGSSDKTYQIQITKSGTGFLVQFQYGRRGGTLTAASKTPTAVSLEEAERIFDKLVHEKTSKGYVPAEGQASAPAILSKETAGSRTKYPAELLEEINREEAEALVKDKRYLLQVKLNGHRRQIEKTKTGEFVGYNKKGEPVPVPAELATALKAIAMNTFFIDGELIGDSYYAFDIFSDDGVDLRAMPYGKRWLILDEKASEFTVDTWHSTAQKQAGLALLHKKRSEGAVFKLIDAPYNAGRNGQHKKFKFWKSCTCKVLAMGTKGHNNAEVGLLKDGKWVNVGGVSMIGKDSRIKVGSLVEIKFLYVDVGNKLYQPTILELRDDVSEAECTFAQLKKAYKEGIKAA